MPTNGPRTRKRVALIAHDSKKRDLAQWVFNHLSALSEHNLISTATTGGIIQTSCPSLELELTKSGPLGPREARATNAREKPTAAREGTNARQA